MHLSLHHLLKIWLPAHQYANQPQEDKNIVVVVVLVLFLVANFSNQFVFYFPLSFIQFYHTLKQWKIKLKLFSHWQYTGPRNHESHTVHTCGAWTMTSVRRVRKIWTAFFKCTTEQDHSRIEEYKQQFHESISQKLLLKSRRLNCTLKPIKSEKLSLSVSILNRSCQLFNAVYCFKNNLIDRELFSWRSTSTNCVRIAPW